MDKQIIHLCELIKNALHQDNEFFINDEIDWSQMIRMSKKQNLLAVFLEEAVKYPAYTSRPEYIKEVQEAMTIVDLQAKRTSAFLGLYKCFVNANVYPLVMKGIICRELYGKLCDHRPSGDEDILIRICDYEIVKSVLIANGYMPQMEVESQEQLKKLQEVSFVHPIEKLHIEVHLNVMGRENDAHSKMSDCFKDVFEDYRELDAGGVRIRTLSHQNHLLFLILHAFKHFIHGGFGIRQMLDILMYQEKFGQEVDYEQLKSVLGYFKADKFWSDLICIGNSYFGFCLSVQQEANCPERLLEDMMFCGTFGNGTQALRTATRAITFATGDYLQKKHTNQFLMFWRIIFPNKVYLLHHAPQLEKRPWLLPVEWVKRWGRFIKWSFLYKGSLANESIAISKKRKDLLKKYNLL